MVMQLETAGKAASKIFADPIVDRSLAMAAMAAAMDNPGRVVGIQGVFRPPHPVNLASATICLACLSPRSRLWTDLFDDHLVGLWFAENCRCLSAVAPGLADFCLVTKTVGMSVLNCFALGHHITARAMLIVQVPALIPGTGCWESPVMGLPIAFWHTWHRLQRQGALVPDLVFTCNDSLSAIPGDCVLRQ